MYKHRSILQRIDCTTEALSLIEDQNFPIQLLDTSHTANPNMQLCTRAQVERLAAEEDKAKAEHHLLRLTGQQEDVSQDVVPAGFSAVNVGGEGNKPRLLPHPPSQVEELVS